MARPAFQAHVLPALRRRILDLLAAHDQCMEGLTEPNVHAVRVAARHLQPILTVLHSLMPGERIVRRAERQVRLVLRSTTALREVQMLRKSLADLATPTALRRALDHDLTGQESTLAVRTHARLHEVDHEALIRLAARRWPGITEATARRALDRAVAKRRKRLLQAVTSLRANEPQTLHRARIALKRYRYLVTLFAPLLPSAAAGGSGRLEQLQARLGLWHDEWVLSDRLLAVANGMPTVAHRRCLELATAKATWCTAEQRRLCALLHRFSAVGL